LILKNTACFVVECINKEMDQIYVPSTPSTPIKRPSGWSKLSHNSHVAIIVGVICFVILAVGVTLAVVLTRPKADNTPSPTTTVTVTTSPSSTTQTILLKNNDNQCYTLARLPAIMGQPGTCTGVWIQDDTNQTLSFDGETYEYCMQYPFNISDQVQGATGRGCAGIVIQNNKVTALQAGPSGINLCINNLLLWDNCVNAFNFVIEPISHTVSRISL